MLPLPKLEITLENLVMGKADIMLQGNKSSGKTTLAKKILNKVIGQPLYVFIKGIIIGDKNSFLFLVGVQLVSVFLNLTRNSQEHDEIKGIIEKHPINYSSIEHWIKWLNNIGRNNEDFFSQVGRVYIMIDNFEEIAFNSNFMQRFYYSCKFELLYIRISFFFCGMSHMCRMLNFEEPYRGMLTFFMPKISLKQVIDKQVDEFFRLEKFPQLARHLKNQLLAKLEIIETNLSRVKFIVEETLNFAEKEIKNDVTYIPKFIKSDEVNEFLKKLIDHNEVGSQKMKTSRSDCLGFREQDKKFNYENYPSLIMTSISLANGYPESEDRRRFTDYRLTKLKKRVNKIQQKKKGGNGFKQNEAIIRHNTQRVLAISQSLESQQQHRKILIEGDLEHHSLDYYGCIEYLREENQVEFYGKFSRAFMGKIIGEAKESEIRDFLNLIGVKLSEIANKFDDD